MMMSVYLTVCCTIVLYSMHITAMMACVSVEYDTKGNGLCQLTMVNGNIKEIFTVFKPKKTDNLIQLIRYLGNQIYPSTSKKKINDLADLMHTLIAPHSLRAGDFYISWKKQLLHEDGKESLRGIRTIDEKNREVYLLDKEEEKLFVRGAQTIIDIFKEIHDMRIVK